MNHPPQTQSTPAVNPSTVNNNTDPDEQPLEQPTDLKKLIMHDTYYYLYISTDNTISYIDNTQKFTRPTNFSKIYQEVNRLELLADQVLGDKVIPGSNSKDEKKLIRYKENIAQALGGVLLNNNDLKISLETLKQIQSKIKVEGNEKIKLAYLSSAFSATVLVILSLFAVWIWSDFVVEVLHSKTAYEILIASLTGGLGSFISSFASFKKYRGNILSGVKMHRIDGLFRVFYGLIAGFVASLAVKANVVGGLLGNSFPGLIFITSIAGASEFFIPSLVAKMDNTLLASPTDNSDTNTKTTDEDTDKDQS